MKRPTEAYRSPQLFETGAGYVVICRFKADGRCEAGFFLLDVFCLGTKDGGFASFANFRDFEEDLLDRLFRAGDPVRMTPAAGRKLIEGAVAYARALGFTPGADYKKASRVFGGITAAECREKFVFGKDGKPFYIQGPSESPERCDWILQTLERSCGKGGYEYIVTGDLGDLDPLDEDAAMGGNEVAQNRDGTGYDLTALQEMARRMQAERPEVEVRINPSGHPKLSDRLSLVAEPLLEMAPDYELRKTVINLAALAWNFRLIDPARAEGMLDDILSIMPGEDGARMFILLAARAVALFPDDDRIIVKVETDPAPSGRIDLRVVSIMPEDPGYAEAMEDKRERRELAFAM